VVYEYEGVFSFSAEYESLGALPVGPGLQKHLSEFLVAKMLLRAAIFTILVQESSVAM